MKSIDLKILGIKCDNPKCDFKDMTVQYKDFKKWLNKPCPKCGANLLTTADYNTTRIMVWIVRLINKILPAEPANSSKIITGHVEMDGTGKADIKIEE